MSIKYNTTVDKSLWSQNITKCYWIGQPLGEQLQATKKLVFKLFKLPVHLVAQMENNLPAMLETLVQSLGWKDPLEKEMATHSSILAWRIPWTEDPSGLQSIGSQRVRHDWSDLAHRDLVTHSWFLDIVVPWYHWRIGSRSCHGYQNLRMLKWHSWSLLSTFPHAWTQPTMDSGSLTCRFIEKEIYM